MTKTEINLLTPIKLGPYELRNRMVMSPMTRSRAGEGEVVTGLTETYYAPRASAGLIVTEGSQVSRQGVGYPNTPGIHTPEQAAGWRRVTEAVRARGGKIFLQLWHVGRVSHPSMQEGGALPVGPSAIAPEGQIFTAAGPRDFVAPRALETDEIPGVVEQFRRAARLALEAGFDGVEVHGANGYLLDQFLQDGTNRRTDRYGGSIENRARLLVEVTEAVVGVWGASRVGVRLSPSGTFNAMSDSDPAETFGYAARALSGLGIAYLHVIEPADNRTYLVEGGPASPTRHLRAHFDGVLVTAQGYDFAGGNAVLAEGAADMVAYGKLFLANPDLPRRFAIGAPLNEPDPSTFYGGGERGYTDYPALSAHAA